MMTYVLTVIIAVIFLFASNSMVNGQVMSENEQLLNQLTEGMNSNITINFFRNYKCNVTKTPKKEIRSAGGWTDIFLRCRDLENSEISAVLCNTRCIDPSNCKVMSELKGVPVFFNRRLVDRNNNVHDIDIPVSCKCVPSNRRQVPPACNSNSA